MSRHVINESKRFFWVVGWDQPLQTFFLQQHKRSAKPDANPIKWWPRTNSRNPEIGPMYELEDLERVMRRNGIVLEHSVKTQLYLDRDEGR